MTSKDKQGYYQTLMRQGTTIDDLAQQIKGNKLKYLTIDNICEMLSISRRTLERMRKVDPKEDDLSNLLGAARKANSLGKLMGYNLEPLAFPDPDLYIGRSPRWEQDKLIAWLQENGSRLQT